MRPHGSEENSSEPQLLSENGGFARTQSKVLRMLPSRKAGSRRVSPWAIRKSFAPWRYRFIRAMADVLRFFSWP